MRSSECGPLLGGALAPVSKLLGFGTLHQYRPAIEKEHGMADVLAEFASLRRSNKVSVPSKNVLKLLEELAGEVTLGTGACPESLPDIMQVLQSMLYREVFEQLLDICSK